MSSKRSLTRRDGLKLAFSAAWARYLHGETAVGTMQVPDLVGSVPLRSEHALTGSQFAEHVSKMDSGQREHAILSQLLEGNLPGFLRQLVPVTLEQNLPGRKIALGVIFVMPEYLAIGSDSDFLRIPMNLYTAMAVADRFGFSLPTRKIVDAIYNQSSFHFKPQPLPPGPQMTSTEYYRIHNTLIDKQAQTLAIPLGALVGGHKKDVVLSSRLARNPGQIAIYGWHRGPGAPIQPLSTVHGAGYADYSHGIRLVGQIAIVEGKQHSVYDILEDSSLANVLSDEGSLRQALEIWVNRLRPRTGTT